MKVPKEIALNSDQFVVPSSSFIRIKTYSECRSYFWPDGSVLTVPADEEFKMALVKKVQDKDILVRARAVRWLAVYPGKDTIEILRSLLSDSSTYTFSDNIIIYPVRQAAYEALIQLGVKVEKSEGLDKEELHYWYCFIGSE